ncbi:MAG TPA: ATP-binding cassette domain-containing protein [Anaerolineae bacterium]|nr:ATP-binding cassette domain-containing protein [Anaerolineae bacterium]
MPLLQASHIHKSFDGTPVLRDVSFDVDAGAIVCLLGPSGCGKTTLLRVVAGLETPDAGVVTFAGRDLAHAPIHERGFGLMFQDFALFPHKNVWENVIFGLRMQNLPRDQIEEQAHAALELVGLTGFEARDVNELSGGEKQRVALARSLAPRPRLLMLDEPLGSLDRKLREELLHELRRILKRAGLTSIYVTHDQQEAFAIADRVAIMNAGRIEQIGAPQDVYRQPASEWVARFLGLSNLLPGIARADATIETPIGLLRIEASEAANEQVMVLIRPDAARRADGAQPNTVEGTLIEQSFRGGHTRALVRVGEVDLTLEFSASTELPEAGQRIRLALKPNSISILRQPHSMTVRKLNRHGELVWSYPSIVLERGANYVRLEARFNRERLDLGYTVFAPGDRFVEWFFNDRWYNIFEVHAQGDDHLKGWYCNVTKPAMIESDSVSAVDLALDVWIGPDGSIRVLDEDEFAALDLPDAERRAARDALEQLKSRARERRPPFDGSQRIGALNG